jgi:hypothetical protein
MSYTGTLKQNDVLTYKYDLYSEISEVLGLISYWSHNHELLVSQNQLQNELIALIMEAVSTCEISIYQTTWRNITEDSRLRLETVSPTPFEEFWRVFKTVSLHSKY